MEFQICVISYPGIAQGGAGLVENRAGKVPKGLFSHPLSLRRDQLGPSHSWAMLVHPALKDLQCWQPTSSRATG